MGKDETAISCEDRTMDAPLELSPELAIERDVLIAEIYAAFDGVTREGGVSWSEADVIDRYRTDEERQIAREQDTEPNWQALVEAQIGPPWDCVDWCFLDPIGWRYYLAAAMIINVQGVRQAVSEFELTLRSDDPGERAVENFSSLSFRQKHCVRWFLRYTITLERSKGERFFATLWRRAYKSYWRSLPPPKHQENTAGATGRNRCLMRPPPCPEDHEHG